MPTRPRKPKARAARKSAAKPARKPARMAVRKPGAARLPRRAPSVRAPGPLPAALVAAVRALDEKKAEKIQVIELGSNSSVADYFVLATGTSDPHLRALRIELDRALEAAGSRVRGVEAQRESGWTVVDAFDIVFHLFRPEQRQAFRLEELWESGSLVPLSEVLGS